MRNNKYRLLELVLIIATGMVLTGCAAPGRTKAEIHRDHMNILKQGMLQIQDDFDSALMLDRPGRLSRYFFR